MASKRVSLKGKGADLFFGDYAPPTQPGTDPDPEADPAPLPDVGALGDMSPSDEAPIRPSTVDEAPSLREDAPRSARTGGSSRDRAAAAGVTRTDPSNGTRASDHDSELASTLAPDADGTAAAIEPIRKVVKVPGREVSFVRLSPEEKARVADIVYTYKRQGQKTTENEINRIALNYLLHDYQEHGERSVLARVLAALRA